MQRHIAAQAKVALAEADLVAFVVDATAGLGPGDEEIADLLRRAQKPVIVVANKLDNPRRHDEALELHSLGLGEPVPISALHGIGTGDLLDRVVDEPARARRAPSARSGCPTRSASRSSGGRTSASRRS